MAGFMSAGTEMSAGAEMSARTAAASAGTDLSLWDSGTHHDTKTSIVFPIGIRCCSISAAPLQSGDSQSSVAELVQVMLIVKVGPIKATERLPL